MASLSFPTPRREEIPESNASATLTRATNHPRAGSLRRQADLHRRWPHLPHRQGDQGHRCRVRRQQHCHARRDQGLCSYKSLHVKMRACQTRVQHERGEGLGVYCWGSDAKYSMLYLCRRSNASLILANQTQARFECLWACICGDEIDQDGTHVTLICCKLLDPRGMMLHPLSK